MLSKKTDKKLNTLKFSFNRLLITIDHPFAPRGCHYECAGTTISIIPSSFLYETH